MCCPLLCLEIESDCESLSTAEVQVAWDSDCVTLSSHVLLGVLCNLDKCSSCTTTSSTLMPSALASAMYACSKRFALDKAHSQTAAFRTTWNPHSFLIFLDHSLSLSGGDSPVACQGLHPALFAPVLALAGMLGGGEDMVFVGIEDSMIHTISGFFSDPTCLLQRPEASKLPKAVGKGCKKCFGRRSFKGQHD